MNIIELQDNLKDLPDRVLMQEMQMPTGNMPQFLVLSELTRRRRMRDEYNRQKAADMPTVAEEVMTAAGAPQGGITAIARNMAPNSSIAQNTGADMAVQREPTRMPQKMAKGGFLSYLQSVLSGGKPDRTIDDEIDSRVSADLDDFLATDSMGNIPSGLVPSSIVAAPDFDATDIDDILDAEEARLVQQEVFDANRGDQPLPDISQIDPETNLDISAALGIGSLGTNLADAMNNPIGDLPFLPPPTELAETESERLLREDVGDFNKVSNVLTEPELSMDELIRQAQIEREGFGATDVSPLPENQFVEGLSGGDPYMYGTNQSSFQRGAEALTAIDQKLAGGGLSESERKALNVQRTALNFALSSGQAIDNAVGDAMALLNRIVTEPLLNVAGGATSIVNPDAGAKVFDYADQFSNYIDNLAEEGYVKDDRTSDENIVPSGISGDDPYDEISPAKLSNVLGQTTGTPLSLEGGIESLLPPSLAGDGTGGGTGDGTGGGAGSPVGDSYSALESRIAKMLDDREKSAETDKYLALAQAGLALMASDSPTLGGALGEAGLVGISQLREARNQYDKDILGLLSTQADIDAARSDAALAERRLDLESRGLDLEEAALDTTGMKPGDLLDYLANLNTQQTNLTKQLSENLVEDPDEINDVRNRIIVNELEIERVKRLLGYGSSTKDLAD